MDDVVLNKAAIIERSLGRVAAEHAGDDANLLANQTRQDSIVLNLQRATEAAIDLAMHLVRKHRLGIPQDSRDAFELLRRASRLDEPLAAELTKMVGFRNVAVHQYQQLDLAIVRMIVRERTADLRRFAKLCLEREAG